MALRPQWHGPLDGTWTQGSSQMMTTLPNPSLPILWWNETSLNRIPENSGSIFNSVFHWTGLEPRVAVRWWPHCQIQVYLYFDEMRRHWIEYLRIPVAFFNRVFHWWSPPAPFGFQPEWGITTMLTSTSRASSMIVRFRSLKWVFGFIRTADIGNGREPWYRG